MYMCSMPFSIHRTANRRTYYGSGSFVADDEEFFLLTCCHNFLTKKEGQELQTMSADTLKEKITENCKVATYEISDTTTFETNAKAASDILLDYDTPHLYIVQVRGRSGYLYVTLCLATIMFQFVVAFYLQDKDLLVIKVKKPATFGISEPIPLTTEVNREGVILPGAQVFSLVQFPFGKKKAPRPLEIAIGEKYYNSDEQPHAGIFLNVPKVII